MLISLRVYGNVAMIERLSVQEENGDMILIENGKRVGWIIDAAKPNVKRVLYKNETYFMKEASINNGVLELRNKVGSIIASRILNIIFQNKEKRYPIISLVFNPDSLTKDVEPFYILSEGLKGFTSIADLAYTQPHQAINIKVEDLENLYMGMYLVGGGDPHMRNIFYNPSNHYLGSVDLDVSFKEHTKYRIQLQHDERTTPDFFKIYSDLAIRTINCSNIFTNFLFATDSRFKQKIPWDNYYDENIPIYQKILKMDGIRVSKSIKMLHAAFPSEVMLRISVVNTIKAIKEDLIKIISEKIQMESSEEGSIFNTTGEYFNKDSDIYRKYKEDSLIKSVEFLFDENEHYIEKICQFVENRYLTLICIFNGSNDMVKETCERCMVKPEVFGRQQKEL